MGSLNSLIRSFGRKLGYEAMQKNQFGPFDYLKEEIAINIKLIQPYTMVTYERLKVLYSQVVFCEKNRIAGSFVECGTWKGGATGLMALGNLKHGLTKRHIHLFDSFEGIPEPDESIDGEEAIRQVRNIGGGTKGRLIPVKGFYERYADGTGTLEINKYLLEKIIGYDAGFIHYNKGWFQDILPRVYSEIGDIAILRLDADWYASTRICLEYLYNKVVKGGFVIIDDYGYYEGCKKAVDDFVESNKICAYFNLIDAAGIYWIKA